MARRNNMVYSFCLEKNIPLVTVMGGGYSRPPDGIDWSLFWVLGTFMSVLFLLLISFLQIVFSIDFSPHGCVSYSSL